MTASDLAKAHKAAERQGNSRSQQRDDRKREAHLDRALAMSQIKLDQYRQVLRRAGLLKK